MPFKKGEGGRKKGAVNRTTTVFKQAVLVTYDAIGGDAAFAEWATANPTEYYRIASRLIPQEVSTTVAMRPLVIDLVTPADVQASLDAQADGD